MKIHTNPMKTLTSSIGSDSASSLLYKAIDASNLQINIKSPSNKPLFELKSIILTAVLSLFLAACIGSTDTDSLLDYFGEEEKYTEDQEGLANEQESEEDRLAKEEEAKKEITRQAREGRLTREERQAREEAERQAREEAERQAREEEKYTEDQEGLTNEQESEEDRLAEIDQRHKNPFLLIDSYVTNLQHTDLVYRSVGIDQGPYYKVNAVDYGEIDSNGDFQKRTPLDAGTPAEANIPYIRLIRSYQNRNNQNAQQKTEYYHNFGASFSKLLLQKDEERVLHAGKITPWEIEYDEDKSSSAFADNLGINSATYKGIANAKWQHEFLNSYGKNSTLSVDSLLRYYKPGTDREYFHVKFGKNSQKFTGDVTVNFNASSINVSFENISEKTPEVRWYVFSRGKIHSVDVNKPGAMAGKFSSDPSDLGASLYLYTNDVWKSKSPISFTLARSTGNISGSPSESASMSAKVLFAGSHADQSGQFGGSVQVIYHPNYNITIGSPAEDGTSIPGGFYSTKSLQLITTVTVAFVANQQQ